MKIDSLIEIFHKVDDILDMLVEICKNAWSHPHTPTLLGIATGAFVLLIAIRAIKHHLKPIKLFNNRIGEVEVSRKALDELVQSVCYSLGALTRPVVKIYIKRGKLCVSVALKLESGQKLTDATGEIQTALTTAFREHMGVEKLGKIDVRVLGFKGLIYKPAHKFLPPVKDENEEILDATNPVIDLVDTPKK